MKITKFFTLFICLFIYGNLTATNYTVVNTGDNGGTIPTVGAGTGTLRQAIIDVNADATAVPHTITFNIAASGLQTITLAAILPTLTHANVLIDGYTEPGAAQGSFSTRTYTVAIDGTSAPKSLYSFTVLASHVVFRGFVLKGGSLTGGAFMSIGVRNGTANTYTDVKFQDNFINVTATGDAIAGYNPISGAVHAYGNVSGGVSSASYVVFGTDGDGINDANEGNLGALCYDGNTSYCAFRDIDNSTIAGNWFGVKPDGVTLVNYVPIPANNQLNYPIYVSNCINSIIGTNGDGVSDALERNVVADGSQGITLVYNYTTGNNPNLSTEPLRAPGNNMVTGNFVGFFPDGKTPTNRIDVAGIQVQGNGNYIGCNTAEITNATYRNIISGLSASCVGIYETPHNNTS